MVEDLTIADYRRTLELLRRYESARLGFVDATVMAVAERLKIQRILTTDRRDFSKVRTLQGIRTTAVTSEKAWPLTQVKS